MAIVVATQPAPEVPAGLAFLAMAFSLGIGTGGVFAWVALTGAERTGRRGHRHRRCRRGLGGYFPPLVMGITYDEAGNDYTVGLALLCLTAIARRCCSRCSASLARPRSNGEPHDQRR